MAMPSQEIIDIHRYEEYKIFFVHIPKTGGNTVFRTLRNELRVSRDVTNPGLRIISRRISLKNRVGLLQRPTKRSRSTHVKMDREVFDQLHSEGFLTFSVVRNPFDRAYSCWKWNNWYPKNGDWNFLMKKLPGNWWGKRMAFSNALTSFEAFLDIVAKAFETYGYSRWWFSPQTTWLYDIHGKSIHSRPCRACGMKVKEICRLEHLREDMKKICKHAGFELRKNDFRFKYNKNPIRDLDDYREAYSDQTRNMVSELYKDDIILLRYGF